MPGFQGTDVPSRDYVDDPVGLTAAGEAQRYRDEYRVIVDPYRTRFDSDTVDLSAGRLIEADPDAYLGAGGGPGGAAGACNPLPPGGTGTTTYLESCNAGSQPFAEARSCNASLQIQTEGRRTWEYSCETEAFADRNEMCPMLAQAQGSSSCTLERSVRVGQRCLQWVEEEFGRRWCAEPGEPIFRQVWQCPSRLSGVPGGIERNTSRIVGETVDEAACQSATNGATCTLASEVCTAPGETRVINGLSVTRSCWEWQRTYQCEGVASANDCGALEARGDCRFSHDECLSFDADGVTCNVHDRWYQCAIPGAGSPPPPAYVCAGDLYCINGECTQVEREASPEFKDAMVAMNVMGELRDGFDPDRLKIFSGEHLRCTRKVFGLSNCCSGKGVPLLTPFLCDREDREVDKRDDAGLCRFIGTYCSSRVLGVCVTRKPKTTFRPALLVAVRTGHRITAIQRIRLTSDGTWHEGKFMLGKPGQGAWAPRFEGNVLAIAEGMEDAASYAQIKQIPCWAALGNERLALIGVPTYVTELYIAEDNDGPGRTAAMAAVDAHGMPRRCINRDAPPSHCRDWAEVGNDVVSPRD